MDSVSFRLRTRVIFSFSITERMERAWTASHFTLLGRRGLISRPSPASDFMDWFSPTDGSVLLNVSSLMETKVLDRGNGTVWESGLSDESQLLRERLAAARRVETLSGGVEIGFFENHLRQEIPGVLFPRETVVVTAYLDLFAWALDGAEFDLRFDHPGQEFPGYRTPFGVEGLNVPLAVLGYDVP